ncbi:Uncharacterised protein [Legionella beliardensis]|uniref:Uncharacterized protein n=1 Tax=Legionella beliardensis TaxID=91822 RepID=A0A378HZR3_9GAMM|nr:hypothetical protein [Legionella beliardensis]STX28428.1 Uncharacterised protein [Legionella beliardensis]
MQKVFRLLAVVLEAFVGIADDKPNKSRLTVYEAREKLDKGSISIREYNESLESK